ncbi:MAG: sigma-54-dependent Fis family transcriptional regulator [Pseudomonadales bacterium]|nr:sigma-54-dependent Fis family transcriptional regulator [Pseudomonadales bacterium]
MAKECILVVEDDDELREAVKETLQLAKFRVEIARSGEEALTVLKRCDVDMVVSDVNMEHMDGIELLENIRKVYRDLPVLIMTAYADVTKAVAAMRLGAVDFLLKPFEPSVLIDTLKQQIGTKSFSNPIVIDPISRKLFLLARKVAIADSTVLLLGESGVGKEVVASFIHKESRRADRPFVAINCAAIPENMLEATMFGYEKGAYTGAYTSKPGKFEQADGGTLLLDEISEMDIGLQAKLLRVLQEREVERLGAKTHRKIDVRVIATTNRNLVDYVKQGKFREDLYYRISVFPLMISSLRARKQDILPLAEHMANLYCRRMNHPIIEFDKEAQSTLTNYDWPGNVRELENVVQRALILQQGKIVGKADLFLDPMSVLPDASELESEYRESVVGRCSSTNSDESLATKEELDPKMNQGQDNLEEKLKQKEFQLIIDVLKEENGSRGKTAEKLGISGRTLRYKLAKMRECGIDLHTRLAAH